MEVRINTREFPKYFIRSIKNITIQELQKLSRNGYEIRIKDKRIKNTSITPELLNFPELDLGPEVDLQVDILANLPPSGGYEYFIKALDVFSRYLSVYPVTAASASSTAK